MAKNKIASLLAYTVIFIFLMSTAYAAGSKLIFSDVDVKVGSKTSKNLKDKDTIDDEAEPGDTIEFRVEVKNNFTDTEDLEIEDITVEVTIEELDDGDDVDEESKEFDLRAGRDKRVTLKFEVPLEVEEETFDVTIHAEGEDENGTDHNADMTLRLEVEKENHLLKITRKTLSPLEVTCNRKNVQVAATVINIGSEDEEDVTFQVLNSDLGVDLKDEVGELTAEPNEEESRFSKVYSFNAPNDAEAGSYPIILRALYDDNRRKAEETATLTVNDCITAKQEAVTKEEQSEEEAEEEEEVEVITGKTIAETPSETTATQESFLKSNSFVAGIIIAEVVAVLVGIALIVSLFRRRG